MHVLVTGQGLRGKETVQSKKDFLLPVGVIKAMFRGKWLSWLNKGYEKGEIQLPDGWSELEWRKTLRTVARKPWNIRIQGAYSYGDGVAIYLSRYIKGGPIKDRNILEADGQTVRFRYKDYHSGKHRTMPIKTKDFISRVLWHVAVKGQHQVRHYGLYSSGARDKRNLVREYLEIDLEHDYQKSDKQPPQCPECGAQMIHVLSARREISNIRNGARFLYNTTLQRTAIGRSHPEMSILPILQCHFFGLCGGRCTKSFCSKGKYFMSMRPL